MIKFLKRLLGIERLEILLEQDLKELSSTDLVTLGRIRRIEKEIAELTLYLGIIREEKFDYDKKNPLNPPKLISSKFIKYEKNTPKNPRRNK